MRSVRFLRIFAVLIVLVLPSCKTDSAESVELRNEQPTRPIVWYLEEAIPPCIPFWSSDHNPCLPGTPPEVETFSTIINGHMPSPFPTWVDILLGGEYATFATHLVIRGEALIETTRCKDYRIKLGNYWYELLGIDGVNLLEDLFKYRGLDYYCFTDIGVKEYIVGSGPPILTVAMHVETLLPSIDFNEWSDSKKDNYVTSWFNDTQPQSRVGTVYEGREMVLLLGTGSTVAVESWEVSEPFFGVWFVQKFGNQIRAVAQDVNRARNDEERSQMDMPLDYLTKQIKKAAEERTALTDGRIGVESYSPLLITDANFLQDFYISEGAVYDDSEDATVLPPPVPGGGDPCHSYYSDQLPWGWWRSSLSLCPTLGQR